MTTQVINLLKYLRQVAIERGLKAVINYHEEDSFLMRFANSAISLNTNEHLVRVDFKAFEGRRIARVEMIVDPSDLDGMQDALDRLSEILPHAQPLSYDPTFPVFQKDVVDERSFDPALAALTNQERLDYFNIVANGLESEDVKLSGIFSNGITTKAQISTANDHIQLFRSTDAQITAVLSSESLKWEVNAEQSAQKKVDLNAQALHQDLALLLSHYQHDDAIRLPVGKYTVVFGPAATAELASTMVMFGMTGAALKQGYSFLTEEDQGLRLFSELLSITDDPDAVELYGEMADQYGMERKPFNAVTSGTFGGFVWDQDSADEFGREPTGHSVDRPSLVLEGGKCKIASLAELVAMERNEDLLYIPYIHYMNVVNPSEGMITGSSRFGALYLRRDGSVQVPFNVRLTQRFVDFFGDGLSWMSERQVVYNISSSYERRNPTALKLPLFICVRGIEISHSNPSY